MLKRLQKLLINAKECVEYFRCQDFYHGNILLNNMIACISDIFAHTDNKNIITDFTAPLNEILNAQTNEDYILIADMIELMLLPTVNAYLTEQISNLTIKPIFYEVNINMLKENSSYNYLLPVIKQSPNPAYSVEFTNSGAFTIKYSGTDTFYYHSNKDPFEEAKKFARYYVKDGKFNYIVLGLGLGYHIKALLEEDRRINVRVIEYNPDILALAFRYSDMKELLVNPRFSLEYLPIDKIGKYIGNSTDSVLLIHYPSIKNIQNKEIKNVIKEYFVSTSSMYSQRKYLDSNFYYNIKRKDEEFSTIAKELKNKRIIYIAGGPSLHYYINDIKILCKEHDVIITCASTVYRNLLSDNIIPDYVVMIDANDNMINHVKDIPAGKSRLLYLCTASHTAVEAFCGEKYIIFQNDYELSEEYCKNKNYRLINTGGSVSTSAIDIILTSGAKELITYGLDLAYTDNKTHSYEAKSTQITNDYILVKSVNGEMIPTIKNLNIYRKWIEKRIANESDIKLTNYSHGAYINGMDNIY